MVEDNIKIDPLLYFCIKWPLHTSVFLISVHTLYFFVLALLFEMPLIFRGNFSISAISVTMKDETSRTGHDTARDRIERGAVQASYYYYYIKMSCVYGSMLYVPIIIKYRNDDLFSTNGMDPFLLLLSVCTTIILLKYYYNVEEYFINGTLFRVLYY